jgi:hypothetical protein
MRLHGNAFNKSLRWLVTMEMRQQAVATQFLSIVAFMQSNTDKTTVKEMGGNV